jgi:hypothetical protein
MEGDEVEVFPGLGDYLLPLRCPLDIPKTISVAGGQLILPPLGSFEHLGADFGDDGLGIPGQERSKSVNQSLIFDRGDGRDAGAGALLDVIEEARSPLRPLPFEEGIGAGPNGKRPQ